MLKSQTKNGLPRSEDLMGKLRDQAFRCALTGVELTPETTTIDHVISVKDGGDESLENLQFVHEAINRMKNTLSQDEFVEWCQRVADWNNK